MAKTLPVSVRLESELNDRVAAVAAALDRSKSWTIEQAVRDFVEIQEWQVAAIEEGLRDVDEGRVADHQDVVQWLQSWGSNHEISPPKCD